LQYAIGIGKLTSNSPVSSFGSYVAIDQRVSLLSHSGGEKANPILYYMDNRLVELARLRLDFHRQRLCLCISLSVRNEKYDDSHPAAGSEKQLLLKRVCVQTRKAVEKFEGSTTDLSRLTDCWQLNVCIRFECR
jgi:hypothetical protein